MGPERGRKRRLKVESAGSVLEFWFGPDGTAEQIAGRQSRLWWAKSAEQDLEIRRRFQDTLVAAATGALDGWAESPEGLLAQVILTDQFSRNIYRGDGRCFSYDALARRWCRHGLDQGLDRKLAPIQRVFLYLPLEHSEARADQNECVSLFERLVDEVAEEEQKLFEGYLDFARRHRDIIERFGRYPHRNDLLGRESRSAELTFLSQPGSSF
jgi:uncharacterized protein (DUF924 family)